ncbi:hypothetical protein KY290_034881 [Solanum tuberosum]|uniref:Uncharacterized protein n=1 Tax=Solanum tuberosum TaxID=4113 RepID=A0ABQ7U517_SOLTU|nr:hypothetical protein KY289_034973 [Solanum tuberosum]KAH0648874.1 hypothetical protein KY285_034122 [Solanum tuberosum]KAH0741838.1 hypothetical protein KY290_034881 [Solanum tuberosum]
MAPGGRVFKQTTLTGETIQDTQSLDELNNPTPLVNTDASTRIKNGRGKTRGKGLEKMKKAMGSKMKIDIPVGKGRPTKPVQSAKLSNELGIIARNFISLPNKWKELTREDRDAALIRCHERFEINLDEHYVKDSCKDILKNRSRQWRYKLKQLFERARSEEEARKIEVPELTPENWNRLCDMWIDPKHKKRCDINKVNRTKLKSNHFMGSKAFVAARAELGENEPEKVEPDRIEFYKHTHYKSKKGWSSLEAETHYNNMKDLKDLYTSGEASMTTDEIVDTVLGTKSGYIRGLGYGPKPNTTRATQRKTAELEDSLRKAKQEAGSAQNNLQNRLNAAETVVENQQTQIQDQQSQIEALNSQLNTIVARQEEMFRKMQCFARSSPSNRDGAP